MAKLVIYTKVTVAHPTNAAINAGKFQPGDVISVLDDEVDLGADDEGDWNTVVYCPGVSVSDLEHLVSTQSEQTTSVIGQQTVTNSTLRKLRMWNCPADKLPALQAAYGTPPVVPNNVLSTKGGFSSTNLSTTVDPTDFTNTYFVQADPLTDPGVIG